MAVEDFSSGRGFLAYDYGAAIDGDRLVVGDFKRKLN